MAEDTKAVLPQKACCTPTGPAGPGMPSGPAPYVRERILEARTGSTQDMVRLDGGAFLMGTDYADAWFQDGEGPVREVTVSPYYIDKYAVTNRQFQAFVDATAYKTEAEAFGWSFVFQTMLPKAKLRKLSRDTVAGLEWWHQVPDATWKHPEGPGSSIRKRLDHPAVHVSWNDAQAYAEWAGKRLLTEAEWEFAARAGLQQKIYPWGDELVPHGKFMCNTWQGQFPNLDSGADGFRGTCPVDAYKPNAFGIYNLCGNVWEWCGDWFHPTYHVNASKDNPKGPPFGDRKLMKGGSYLCHVSYCNRYRIAARTSNTPDSSTGNCGFRCARDV